MLCLISPAKTLRIDNFAALPKTLQASIPLFAANAAAIAKVLRTKSPNDFKSLMTVSAEIASRTLQEYQSFNCQDAPDISYEPFYSAGLLFDGPAYRGLDCESLWTQTDDNAAAVVRRGISHVRFLSGLYGILRMTDAIQRHRLEMSTKVSVDGTTKNLYEYWSPRITEAINNEAKMHSNSAGLPFLLINCASDEYFKVISVGDLHPSIKIIDCVFKDQGRIVSVYAKRARGLFARYVCLRDDILSTGKDSIEVLSEFDLEGYRFDPRESRINPNTERSTLVFNRTAQRVVAPTTKGSVDVTETAKRKKTVGLGSISDGDEMESGGKKKKLSALSKTNSKK